VLRDLIAAEPAKRILSHVFLKHTGSHSSLGAAVPGTILTIVAIEDRAPQSLSPEIITIVEHNDTGPLQNDGGETHFLLPVAGVLRTES
jgi:hypothetical protein